MNPQRKINWTKWGTIVAILAAVIAFIAYVFPRTLPPTTSNTGNFTANGKTIFQNATIQNVNITEIQASATEQGELTRSPEELLQENLLLVALKSDTDGPIVPVMFGLPPGSSTQENDGLYHTKINVAIAVAPGSRDPWIDTITTPPGIHCTLPTLQQPREVIVSGEHLGRVAYIFASECAANHEITVEDMSNIQSHYNY